MPLFLTFEKYFIFFQQLETFDNVENLENISFQFLFYQPNFDFKNSLILSVKISSKPDYQT